MERHGDEVRLSEGEASGSTKGRGMRRVLAVGLIWIARARTG